MLLQALCIISYPSVNLNWSYSPETPDSDKMAISLSHTTSKFEWWPWKTIGHLFYAISSFVHHYVAICEFKLESQYGNARFRSKSAIFLSHVTWKFDEWHWKTIGHLFYATSPSVHFLQPSVNSTLSYSPETPISGQNRRVSARATLKFDGQPCKTIGPRNAQIGAKFVLSSVTLTFDIWPWSFARTSLLSIVITPGNFMMIRWRGHNGKVVVDRRTDRRTDWTIHRAAWSHLNTQNNTRNIFWNNIYLYSH